MAAIRSRFRRWRAYRRLLARSVGTVLDQGYWLSADHHARLRRAAKHAALAGREVSGGG